MSSSSEPIHILHPSPARRAMAFGMQLLLGLLLLYLALAFPPANPGWRVFLVVLGLLAVGLAWRGWTGSARAIIYDDRGLHTEDGALIADIANITSVDRGAFAFKPSNGFVLRLSAPMERNWVPGMWWRIGRRVGVGGVLSGADTKFVADALAVQLGQG